MCYISYFVTYYTARMNAIQQPSGFKNFLYVDNNTGCPKKCVHFLKWRSFGTWCKSRPNTIYIYVCRTSKKHFRLSSVFKCRFSAYFWLNHVFSVKSKIVDLLTFVIKTFSTLFCPKSQFPVPKLPKMWNFLIFREKSFYSKLQMVVKGYKFSIF